MLLHQKNSRGFTLIEILISMLLLVSILAISALAYRFFTERWSKELGQFNRSYAQLRGLQQLQGALDDVFPYWVNASDSRRGIYFEGNPNGFVAIRANSLFNEGVMAVFRLSLVQQEDFSFSLHYEEMPLTNGYIQNATDDFNFSQKLTLFSNLEQAEFFYYFKDDTVQSESVNLKSSKPEQVTQEFNGLTKVALPLRIELSMSGGNPISGSPFATQGGADTMFFSISGEQQSFDLP